MRAVATGTLLALLALLRVPADPVFRACLFYRITGRLCPLCGLTRGLGALLHGHWAQAVAFNALTPVALVLLLSLCWNAPAVRRLWCCGLGAFAAYGLLRLAA